MFVFALPPSGFAHYSLVSRKWKLFGSQVQEREFQCHCIGWWSKYVIAACKT
jgi:hypothetical protein